MSKKRSWNLPSFQLIRKNDVFDDLNRLEIISDYKISCKQFQINSNFYQVNIFLIKLRAYLKKIFLLTKKKTDILQMNIHKFIVAARFIAKLAPCFRKLAIVPVPTNCFKARFESKCGTASVEFFALDVNAVVIKAR